MRLAELKPLEEGVPVHDVLRTTAPFDDIPHAPIWMMIGVFAVDIVLWGVIIAAGWAALNLISGWL
jgi:hypothetical protein